MEWELPAPLVTSWRSAMSSGGFSAQARVAQGRPVLLTGTSLGAISALYLAANFPVSGIVLLMSTENHYEDDAGFISTTASSSTG